MLSPVDWFCPTLLPCPCRRSSSITDLGQGFLLILSRSVSSEPSDLVASFVKCFPTDRTKGHTHIPTYRPHRTLSVVWHVSWNCVNRKTSRDLESKGWNCYLLSILEGKPPPEFLRRVSESWSFSFWGYIRPLGTSYNKRGPVPTRSLSEREGYVGPYWRPKNFRTT